MEAEWSIVTLPARSLLGIYSKIIALITFMPKAYAADKAPVMRGTNLIPCSMEAGTSIRDTAYPIWGVLFRVHSNDLPIRKLV
jgi:hypothetical protein